MNCNLVRIFPVKNSIASNSISHGDPKVILTDLGLVGGGVSTTGVDPPQPIVCKDV